VERGLRASGGQAPLATAIHAQRREDGQHEQDRPRCQARPRPRTPHVRTGRRLPAQGLQREEGGSVNGSRHRTPWFGHSPWTLIAAPRSYCFNRFSKISFFRAEAVGPQEAGQRTAPRVDRGSVTNRVSSPRGIGVTAGPFHSASFYNHHHHHRHHVSYSSFSSGFLGG
jgi:hypothetical protein